MIIPHIYVAAHEETDFPEDPGYIPIHVGKAISERELLFAGDNTGQNISHLNPYFCECTALYWIANNCKEAHVGLVHYRRFFAPKQLHLKFSNLDIASSNDFAELDNGVDLIVSAPMGLILGGQQQCVEQHYFGVAVGFDLFLTRQAIKEKCIDYLEAFDFVMRNCQLVAFNMLVGRNDVVKDYSEWLFSLLFSLKETIPYKTYDDYQKRVFGFLAERLFTVWIVKNRSKYKIAHRPVVYCG